MKSILIQRKYYFISKVLIAILILLTLLPYLPLPFQYSKTKMRNDWIPLLWGIFCAAMWFIVPRIHPIGRIKKKDSILFDVITCATILIGCRLGAGFLIDGLGKSPYDLSPQGIMKNIYIFGPELVAKELIRGYYLSTYCRKGSNKLFYFITILLAISNINIESIFSTVKIEGMEGLVSLLAENIGPELCKSILLSYFALYGGPAISIIYVALIAGFLRFFPVLPTLQWITEGVVSMLIPILEVFYIAEKYEKMKTSKLEPQESLPSTIGWTVTLILSVGFIWFIVGVFPIYPSVIATGSMRPLIYEGDVILIQKAMKEQDIINLKEGDIIQFSRDDILITHRIIQVLEDEHGNRSFQTKGDNNSAEDSRIVLPNEVRGTLVKVVPKVGIPTLWVKSNKQGTPEGVEY